jgi:hypothetical protein
MTNKKFYLAGMAVLLSVSLFLIGCPTEAADGTSGRNGSDAPIASSTATVTAETLAALFDGVNTVKLIPLTTTVDGVVPEGKTLEVYGATTKVAVGQSLEVKGSVVMKEGAGLDASFVSGGSGSGYLKGAGTVSGAGGVKLPYFDADITPPTGALSYTSTSITAVKAIGSYNTTGSAGNVLAASDLPTIFALDGINELTVYNLEDIVTATIPANKTLTLTGTGNELDSADLAVAGTLVVAAGAELAASTYAITTSGNGVVTNNGTINSTATVAATQKALVTVPGGSGKVVFSGEGAGTIDGSAKVTLSQDVEIASSGKLIAPAVAVPFGGTKTITIEGTGVLDFGLAAVTSIGTMVVNHGTAAGAVTTATTSDAVLQAIMEAGGKITSTGAITELTVTMWTVPTNVELTASGTFANGIYPVVVNGKLTAASATFAETVTVTVGADAEVSAALATFAAAVNVSIGAGATVNAAAATFAAATTLTVNGDLTVGAALALTAGASTGITGSGSITAGALTTSAAATKLIESAVATVEIGAATITTGFTAPADKLRTLDGATISTAAATVNGPLTLTGDTTLSHAITIGDTGSLILPADGEITLAANATSKITGGSAYEITAESGDDTGTLTAGGTGTVVVFTAAGIAGYAVDAEGTPYALAEAATDPTSAATLAFGTADSELAINGATSLAGVILDVSAKGKIIVAEDKVLTLALGAGDNHVGSGGIFTGAVSGGTGGTVVKANAVAVKGTSGALADVGTAGSAIVVKTESISGNSDLGTGTAEPAAGTITGEASSGTTIEANVAFEVTGAVITLDS